MIFYRCDRCKNEEQINRMTRLATRSPQGTEEINKDICHDCTASLKEWMKRLT